MVIDMTSRWTGKKKEAEPEKASPPKKTRKAPTKKQE